VPWTEIARLRCHPRTAKKYLSQRPRPPRYGPRRRAGKPIDPFTGTIDAWLRGSGGGLLATPIFERLSADFYRFGGPTSGPRSVTSSGSARPPSRCTPLRGGLYNGSWSIERHGHRTPRETYQGWLSRREVT
jgi:hypothetical protein